MKRISTQTERLPTTWASYLLSPSYSYDWEAVCVQTCSHKDEEAAGCQSVSAEIWSTGTHECQKWEKRQRKEKGQIKTDSYKHSPKNARLSNQSWKCRWRAQCKQIQQLQIESKARHNLPLCFNLIWTHDDFSKTETFACGWIRVWDLYDSKLSEVCSQLSLKQGYKSRCQL